MDYNYTRVFSVHIILRQETMRYSLLIKVTVDLQRPNFAKIFFFAPDIAKIVI